MYLSESEELNLAFEYIEYTQKNVFLTGKAGTGKTTFLKNLRKLSTKRMVVVAPTGVAAINAGGVTIHSFFHIPLRPITPDEDNKFSENNKEHWLNTLRFTNDKLFIIRTLDLLIIDEISMVRADVLDAVDMILRRIRRNDKPFGGVQLLLIGDIYQLPPVVKNEEWQILQNYYPSPFFFHSHAFTKLDYVSIELTHIFRQNEVRFINLLNQIRENNIDTEVMELLSSRYIPDFTPPSDENYIILTTHNYQAKQINDSKLQDLQGEPVTYEAEIKGDFPESNFPTDKLLELKVGAQVMFIRNDTSYRKSYYNGKIGIVTDLNENTIKVKCKDDDYYITVEKDVWENIRYTIDPETKEIKEEILGTFRQYPLKLAWAITIHKSQGLTFDKVIIDASYAFAQGQIYVALSRCRTLEGLVLKSPINTYKLSTSSHITSFSKQCEELFPDQQDLISEKLNYQKELVFELFSFVEIRKTINYFINQTNKHSNQLAINYISSLQFISLQFNKAIETVANKFITQLKALFNQSGGELNSAINERIIKAVDYFDQQLTICLGTLVDGIFIEADNKEVRSTLQSIFQELQNKVLDKIQLLKTATNGFDVIQYQKTRTALLLKQVSDANVSPRADALKSKLLLMKHPILYKELKNWIQIKARELNKPENKVLSTKALVALANQLPCNFNELMQINEIPKTAVKKYGLEILQLIINYVKQNNLKETADIDQIKETYYKLTAQSHELTISLFKQGKTVSEIAHERKLSTVTIENHLSKGILKGEISVFDVIDAGIFEQIHKAYREHPRATQTEIKKMLSDEISFGQIHMVKAHIDYINTVEKQIEENNSYPD